MKNDINDADGVQGATQQAATQFNVPRRIIELLAQKIVRSMVQISRLNVRL